MPLRCTRLPRSRHCCRTRYQFAWRKDGIKHAWNPETIAKLQLATRQGNYEKFKQWSKLVDEKESPIFIRDFFGFKKAAKPTPIDEVESVESIVKHFVTGAMSFGALSIEITRHWHWYEQAGRPQ